MQRILMMAAAAVALNATAAFAFGDDTLKANDQVMRERIEQGRYNGQLTRREYRDLTAEQARIKEMEQAAMADGRISKREYREIHDAQIDAYRHVKAESTDGQVSFWRRWLYLNRY